MSSCRDQKEAIITKRIDEKRRIAIAQKVLKEGRFPGFYLMGCLPTACEKAEKEGIMLHGDQPLRHRIVNEDDEEFCVFLLNGNIVPDEFWAIFKIAQEANKYDPSTIMAKPIFKGFVKNEIVKKV